MSDKNNIKPNYYVNSKIECFDVIEEVTVNLKGLESFCAGNVIKYIYRYGKKNGVEDLKKARTYIDKLIEIVEAKG